MAFVKGNNFCEWIKSLLDNYKLSQHRPNQTRDLKQIFRANFNGTKQRSKWSAMKCSQGHIN